MKQWLLRWLVVAMMLPGFAYAQALPVSAVQRSIAGMVEKKMVQRGFASNDPRWGATLQAGGSSIAGAALAAAAVTAAGVTAPAWATVAATAALGALLGAGINLAIDGVKWLINGDGSVKYTVSGGSPSTTPPTTGDFASINMGNYSIYMGTAEDVLAWYNAVVMPELYPPASWGVVTRSMSCGMANSYTRVCNIQYQSGATIYEYHGNAQNQIPQSYVCPSGQAYKTGVGCQALPATSTPQEVTKSPTEAADALTPEQKAKPANPELLAKIADEAWKRAAAAPGYAGVPYDASQPITTADAQAYQQANPSNWPTVGDMVKPQAAPSTAPASQPWTLPSSAADPVAPPSSGNTTPPITSPTLDWSIPAYGDQIAKQAAPVSFVPTVFAAPTGCPAPISYQMFGKSYQLTYSPFCDLMATLAPIFLAIGAAAAALIFAESLKS